MSALVGINALIVHHGFTQIHHATTFKNDFTQVILFDAEGGRIYWRPVFTVFNKIWIHFNDGYLIDRFILVNQHILRCNFKESD